MFCSPTEDELHNFGHPDFTIYNGGAFPANRYTSYMTSSTSIDVSLKHKEMVGGWADVWCGGAACGLGGGWTRRSTRLPGPPRVPAAPPCQTAASFCPARAPPCRQVILGTQYAGEMKKGVFSLMNYVLPKMGILSLHSGCNEGKNGDVTLFFGLSGARRQGGCGTAAARGAVGGAREAETCAARLPAAVCTRHTPAALPPPPQARGRQPCLQTRRGASIGFPPHWGRAAQLHLPGLCFLYTLPTSSH